MLISRLLKQNDFDQIEKIIEKDFLCYRLFKLSNMHKINFD